jgi:hypothetical protein
MPGLVEMAGAYNLVQIKTTIESICKASEQLKLNANALLALEALMLNIPDSGINNATRQQIEVKNA